MYVYIYITVVLGAIPTYDSLNPIVHSSTHKNSPNRTPKYWLETLVGPQKDNIPVVPHKAVAEVSKIGNL